MRVVCFHISRSNKSITESKTEFSGDRQPFFLPSKKSIRKKRSSCVGVDSASVNHFFFTSLAATFPSTRLLLISRRWLDWLDERVMLERNVSRTDRFTTARITEEPGSRRDRKACWEVEFWHGGGAGIVGWDLLHIDDTFGTLVSNRATKKKSSQSKIIQDCAASNVIVLCSRRLQTESQRK